MTRTTNNDLSFATNVRRKNAEYVIMHKMVKIAIRAKLGLSKSRNNGFGRGRDLSSRWKLAVDGGLPFGVGGKASVWTTDGAEFSVG